MAAFKEYAHYDGLGLAELIRSKDVTAEEVLEAALAAVAAVDPKLNAVVYDMTSEATRTLKAGLPQGPFTGVPFMIKDFVINYAGVPKRSGCRLFEGYVPDHDSELMARFRRAGLVTIAKTSTSEVGFNASTEAVAYGKPTHNPWDTRMIAGGSSGGSSAAVAARMVPLAHANDGGGSIRIPASVNGVFGLKPTRGRVPLGPDVGDDAFAGFATEFIVSRSVRDSAALLDAVCGPDIGATFYAAPPTRPYQQDVGVSPGRLRVGCTATLSDDVTVHPDCRAGLADVAKLCDSLGHHVVEITPRFDRQAFARAWVTAVVGWVAAIIDGTAAALGRTPGLDNLEAATWSALQYGRKQKTVELVGALMTLNLFARAVAHLFREYDVLLTPTLSEPQLPAGSLNQNQVGVDAYEFMLRGSFAFAHTCPFFNATGQPAMSVPLYWNAAGQPVGVHFVGRYGEKSTLIRLAAQLEEARPWASRRPPISA